MKGVPKYEIPKPVMLKKKVQEDEKAKVKDIPCPYDECEELLSRQEFRAHLNKHREQNKSDNNTKNVDNDSTQEKGQEESHGVVSNNEKMETEIDSFGDRSVSDKSEKERDQSSLTLDKMDNADDSVEIVEEKSGDNSLNKSKQTEKQSSILSFFKRFDPRPMDEVEEIY